MAENEPDFAALCAAVKGWRARTGWTQEDVTAFGGPSEPTLRALENGSWSSSRPQATLKKLDKGMKWPEGTAFRVLYRGFDPLQNWDDAVDSIIAAVDDELENRGRPELKGTLREIVGGGTQDGGQYVESSTGKLVESGVTNEDLLREILRSRAESDQIRAEVRDLSQRVARLEQPDT